MFSVVHGNVWPHNEKSTVGYHRIKEVKSRLGSR